MTKWRLDWRNPRILETLEDVDEVNAQEVFEGCKKVWKLGDECYRVKYKTYRKGEWDGRSNSSKNQAD